MRQVGYSFAPQDEKATLIDTPSEEALRAVNLLVEYKTDVPGGPPVRSEQWFFVHATMVSEVVRKGLMHLVSRSSDRAASSQPEEARALTGKSWTEAEFQDARVRLKLIIDNPALAEIAFPDPQLRKTILPMVDDLHEADRSQDRPAQPRE